MATMARRWLRGGPGSCTGPSPPCLPTSRVRSSRRIRSPRASTIRASARSTLTCATPDARSEEHTSELQSHHDLVCRLLLAQKKDDVDGREENTANTKTQLNAEDPKTH